MALEQSTQLVSFQRRSTHTLTVGRIEAAACVAKWQQPAWKFFKLVEMSAHAGGKSKARDLDALLGVFERFVNRRGAQLLRIGDKTGPIGGRSRTVMSYKSYDPSVSLYWQYNAGDSALSWRIKRHYGFPVDWLVVGEDSCGIDDIDPNNGLFGSRLVDGSEKIVGKPTVSRGVNYQVGRERFALPVTVLKADCRNRTIGRSHKVADATMLVK